MKINKNVYIITSSVIAVIVAIICFLTYISLPHTVEYEVWLPDDYEIVSFETIEKDNALQVGNFDQFKKAFSKKHHKIAVVHRYEKPRNNIVYQVSEGGIILVRIQPIEGMSLAKGGGTRVKNIIFENEKVIIQYGFEILYFIGFFAITTMFFGMLTFTNGRKTREKIKTG